LAGQLLALHPDLLVLMLSMYDNPATVNRAMQAGARGYVLKDAPSSDILQAIDTLVAGGTFLSQDISGRLLRSQTPRPLLSARESAILSHLAKGHSSKQMALELGVSARTIETHRQNIRRKLNLEGQAELIKYAVEHCREFDLP
jgi:DNA-binding NarL/FixJ family response regulator